jgi:O-antigen ligase
MRATSPAVLDPAIRFVPPSRGLGTGAVGKARVWSYLSLRGLRIESVFVLAYIVISRIGYLPAAKLGFNLGPVPVFLTDVVLLLLLTASFVRSPIRLLSWFAGGVGTGPVGGAVWLLCLLAVAEAVAAMRGYGMFALRDLAIFGYSLFFPLTYLAISDRSTALKLTRYFIYAGVVLAALVVIEVVTGIDMLVVEVGKRWLGSETIEIVGTDDVGGIIAFSLVALMAYILTEPEQRPLNCAGAAICVLALVLNTARCAVLAVVVGIAQTFFLLRWRHRVNLALLAICTAGVVILAFALGVLTTDTIKNFYAAALAGATGSDDSSQFRLERWQYAIHLWRLHPVIGNGFGVPLAKASLLAPKELEGQFNVGMPHNTFLFLLCRVGIVGLAVVGFCWAYAWYDLAAVVRQTARGDELAVANILVAMAAFASFVLFFERPMNGASFWIMAAVATKLAWFARNRPLVAASRGFADGIPFGVAALGAPQGVYRSLRR